MAREKNTEGIVEAVLFIAGRFLTVNDLVMYTGINPLSIKETMKKLEQKYKNNTGALDLIIKGELYKMDIKQEYAYLTNKLASGSAEFTKAEQETLAIIAYKQPINQSLVVKIRGNKAYDHVKKLIDVGLVKPKKVGHTYELRLDDAFYDYFGLKARERLEAEAKSVEARGPDEDASHTVQIEGADGSEEFSGAEVESEEAEETEAELEEAEGQEMGDEDLEEKNSDAQ